MKQLEAIFEAHHRQLFVSAIAITRNREAAEDVVHDAIMAVAQAGTRPNDLKAYLFRCVRNKALHYLKHRERNHDPLSEPDLLDSAGNGPDQQLFVDQVIGAMQALHCNEQQVLIMKLFADFTFQEIADITDNSPNTVASWYRRGLEKLKEKLHEK